MRSLHQEPPGTFTLDRDRVLVLPATVESAATARQWLTRHLAGSGATVEASRAAVLVLSELVTNAIRHGSGPVVCTFNPERPAEISVVDFGDGEVKRRRRRLAAEVGGRGLDIVERSTTRWGVTRFPGGKAVWAMLPE